MVLIILFDLNYSRVKQYSVFSIQVKHHSVLLLPSVLFIIQSKQILILNICDIYIYLAYNFCEKPIIFKRYFWTNRKVSKFVKHAKTLIVCNLKEWKGHPLKTCGRNDNHQHCVNSKHQIYTTLQ